MILHVSQHCLAFCIVQASLILLQSEHDHHMEVTEEKTSSLPSWKIKGSVVTKEIKHDSLCNSSDKNTLR